MKGAEVGQEHSKSLIRSGGKKRNKKKKNHHMALLHVIIKVFTCSQFSVEWVDLWGRNLDHEKAPICSWSELSQAGAGSHSRAPLRWRFWECSALLWTSPGPGQLWAYFTHLMQVPISHFSDDLLSHKTCLVKG